MGFSKIDNDSPLWKEIDRCETKLSAMDNLKTPITEGQIRNTSFAFWICNYKMKHAELLTANEDGTKYGTKFRVYERLLISLIDAYAMNEDGSDNADLRRKAKKFKDEADVTAKAMLNM